MLTFNNKILTVSNKGLEVAAGPTPPAPEPDLLLTLASATYTAGRNQSTTILSGRTWDTEKNFIVYKMNLLCNSGHSGASEVDIVPNGTYIGLGFGKYLSDDYNYRWDAKDCYFNAFDFTGSYVWRGTFTVGANGRQAVDLAHAKSAIGNPSIKMRSTPLEYKLIFDKSQKIVYCYIGNANLANISFAYYDIDQSTSTISVSGPTDWSSTESTSVTMDLEVYACDSLAEAEGV